LNYECQCHPPVINDLSFARLYAIRIYQASPTTHAKSTDANPEKAFYWTTDHTLIIIRTVGIKS